MGKDAQDASLYKVPLDYTPSQVNNNLSSTYWKVDAPGEKEPRCFLAYSSGLDFCWLHTRAGNLAPELGKSRPQNRYDCVKTGVAEDGDSPEGKVFVLEENVDATWSCRRGYGIDADSGTPTSSSSILQRQGSFKTALTTPGALRMRQTSLHRITGRHTAMVACVLSSDSFEVEFYTLARASDISLCKCVLLDTFSPGRSDPTAKWEAWNRKQKIVRPCFTQGSAVVRQLGDGPVPAAAASGDFSFLDSVGAKVCVGCSSGDIFVFQTLPEHDDELEITHLATLSSFAEDKSQNFADASPVSCLCSLEDADLASAAGAGGSLAGCPWKNVLVAGHDDGTVAMWTLGDAKASASWRTNVSRYLDGFDKSNDALVSAKLSAGTNQLVLATMSGHIVVLNFAEVQEERRGSMSADSNHLVALQGGTLCVSSVHVTRAHAGWITGLDLTADPATGKRLIASCSQDGSVHAFELLSEDKCTGDQQLLRCLVSYSSQFTQYTGLSFARVGEGSAKVALSAYEDSDVSVLHVRL